jgi:GNAT superfamily N-acetyltransferase
MSVEMSTTSIPESSRHDSAGPEVRAAHVEDAHALARLADELGYPTSAAQIRARLERLRPRPEHWIGVAIDRAGAVLGWIHVARAIALETGEFAEILGLVVSNACRRTGVGRELVSAAERWCRQAGLARITVRSNVLRSESHLFYPSLGYSRSKSQHVYVKSLF